MEIKLSSRSQVPARFRGTVAEFVAYLKSKQLARS